jgi:hypothetical protein
MVDLEQIKALRALGVKSIEIHKDGAHFVEFFEPAPPLVEPGRFDADTLIPPAPEGEQPEREARAVKIAPALSRLLKNGSIS